MNVKKLIIGISLFAMSLSTYAVDIKLGVGLSMPPYIIKGSNTGIELDVFNSIMKKIGKTSKVVYMPPARWGVSIEKGLVDAVATINEKSGMKCNYTDTYITYQNVAISLKKNNINVKSIADLAGKSVVSFQNATKYLGDEFASVAKANSKYTEKADQKKQNIMLFSNRAQVVVGDINIFKYFITKVASKVDTSSEYVVHEIFPKVKYKMCFKNAALRDQFNVKLKEMKASGEYDKIVKKYIK